MAYQQELHTNQDTGHEPPDEDRGHAGSGIGVAGRARALIIGRRRRLPAEPQPRHRRRAPRPAATRSGPPSERGRRPVGVLADLPGPEDPLGARSRTAACTSAPARRCASWPGEGRCTPATDHRRLPDAGRRRAVGRPGHPGRRRHHARWSTRGTPTRSADRAHERAPRWAGPACTCRPSACASPRPPTRTSSCSPHGRAPVSSSWPSRSCGAPSTSSWCGSAAGPRPPDDRGQDRDRAGRRQPRRHPGRGRRRHGGPRRPRHRAPAGGRAARAEAGHPGLRRGGRAGDHRDADAGVDDHVRRHRRVPRSATWPTPCSTAPTR